MWNTDALLKKLSFSLKTADNKHNTRKLIPGKYCAECLLVLRKQNGQTTAVILEALKLTHLSQPSFYATLLRQKN